MKYNMLSNKVWKLLTFSIIIMLTLTGCMKSEEEKAFSDYLKPLESAKFVEMIKYINETDYAKLSTKELQKYSSSLSDLPDKPIFNEVNNLNDLTKELLDAEDSKLDAINKGGKYIETNIISIEKYLTQGLDGFPNTYIGYDYKNVYGTLIPEDTGIVTITLADSRNIDDGVHTFKVYADGEDELIDKRGFKKTATKYKELSTADIQVTTQTKLAKAKYEQVQNLAKIISGKMSNEKGTLNLLSYIKAIVEKPVVRIKSTEKTALKESPSTSQATASTPHANKSYNSDLDQYIQYKNKTNQEIIDAAAQINTNVGNYAQLKNLNNQFERLAAGIVASKQKMLVNQTIDNTTKQQLAELFELELTRVQSLARGVDAMLKDQDGTPYFAPGTRAAYQYDELDAIFTNNH